MSTQKSSIMTFRELFRTIRKTILNTNSGCSSRGAKLKPRENLFETRFGFPALFRGDEFFQGSEVSAAGFPRSGSGVEFREREVEYAGGESVFRDYYHDVF